VLAILQTAPHTDYMKIAVVIPAYNEGKHIIEVLNSIPSEVSGNQVIAIVVDDGSRDHTARYVQDMPGVYLARHRSHLGRGAAAKTGCDIAFKLGADLFVLMSAHCNYSAHDVSLLVAPLLAEASPTMVLGRQKCSGTLPVSAKAINAGISTLAKVMFGIRIHDTQSAFRAFPRSLYPDIRWGACNSAMETEMLILAAEHKAALVEVEISSYDDVSAARFKVEDGLYIIQTLLKVRLNTLREYQSAESPIS
jgi:glycosyltransferase involved in cell wall biosynthesis